MTWARRVEILRPFTKYYRQFDPETPVVDSTHFGRGHRRLTPHIYTDREIADLLHAAGQLQPAGLRPATYQTLFGLLAAAGLRLSEATRLREADVDLAAGTLTVRETKFKKSRLLPLHPTTVDALSRYRAARDRVLVCTSTGPFFVGSQCRALPNPTIHGVFAGLRHTLGWVARGGHPRPRLHDLRHTFAVRRVQQWQESGVPTDQGMFWLSTYLGHASIANTYWYLTGVPELLQLVGTQFARFVFEGLSGQGATGGQP
jgi:integrase/recombinase XerC